jgi:hypothetical protein
MKLEVVGTVGAPASFPPSLVSRLSPLAAS